MYLFNTASSAVPLITQDEEHSGIQDCCRTCLDVGDEHVDNGGPGLVQRLVPNARPTKINGFND